VVTWLNASFETRFRLIGGLTVRFAASQDRTDHALLLSPWPEKLARNGRSNTEISTELFISPRTVEWHLGKVFTKLGISSRKELRAALPDLGLIPV
jgi:DNA-binding NarL/FixJ family response regulator